MKYLARILMLGFVVSATVWGVQEASAQGDRLQNRDLPAGKSEGLLPAPMSLDVDYATFSRIDATLWKAKGERQVIVRLKTPAVAKAVGKGPSVRAARRHQIVSEQEAFTHRCRRVVPDAKILARTQLVLNAVFMEVDAAALPELARDPAVIRITPVSDYQLDLSETVPQIGAAAVQAAGVDGSGVSVAVFDTGIDYTHAKMGGAGTLAAYEAAYGTDTGPFGTDDAHTVLDDQFPSDKVVGGFDFVGEDWPFGSLAPDPDPIPGSDLISGGHGTHVADIIGGTNGVAPGVDLYAVKVCATYSGSCSGVALIQGMELAVDPDGDGNPQDHLDIVNMSLGSFYGQPFDEDLSEAVDNASALGVLTVASAGNGFNGPYVTGTPAAAKTALSVAQTEVASATTVQAMRVDLPAASAGNYFAVFQPWAAPLTSTISEPVQYGDGAGGNLDGCLPFAAGSLAGKIVVVNIGGCFFTRQIINIQGAGGVLGIIGLVVPVDPFAGTPGDPDPILIPAFMIHEADADILRTGAADVTFDPNNLIPFNALMRFTSSRGPAYDDANLKPEIGAPGASVSASSGTATGESTFGGTSGAAPMVAGSAALVLQARDDDSDSDSDSDSGSDSDDDSGSLSPLEVKALLMNTADNDVSISQGLAPVSRIGGGEVRADRAVASAVAAWDTENPSGALSFGFLDVADEVVTLTKTVRVRNYSDDDLTFAVTSTFRFADDAANGAVSISAPATVEVAEGSDTSFQVTLTIDGMLLRNNLMSSGIGGDDPGPLTINEYDGYLLLEPDDDDSDSDDSDSGDSDSDSDAGGLSAEPITMAWHVLPRKAARVAAERSTLDFSGGPVDSIALINTGVGTAQNGSYSLLALSPDLPEGGRGEQAPTPDLRAFGVQTFLVPEGFCDLGETDPDPDIDYVMAFAFNTWERQTMAQFPGRAHVALDTDRDGSDDFLVANFQLSSFGAFVDRRNVTVVFDLNLGGVSAFFFTEQATHTANQVLLVCDSQIGTQPLFANMDATVFIDDVYFGGPGDALASAVTLAPLGERYLAFGLPDLPGGGSGAIDVFDFGPAGTNPNELGVMVFTNGDRGSSSRGGATADTEVLFFTVPGVAVP